MAAAEDVPDLTALSELSEDSLLATLKLRYEKKSIYTYSGSILVSVNPFAKLSIFSKDIMKLYRGRSLADNQPHVYGVAEISLSGFKNFMKNQSIVISGESGSGKSETTRLILEYFTQMTSTSNRDDDEKGSLVSQQILEANSILESFGNAKTDRNNNSSRFGKFIQIQMDGGSRIVGASVLSYLLEKGRIVRVSPTERNYHVFYELVRGASPEERAKYKLLTKVEQYTYLKRGQSDAPGQDDVKNYDILRRAMVVLQMELADVDSVFKLLSAILLLGNVEFDGNDQASIKNAQTVKDIAELLGCEEKSISKVLLSRKLVTGKDVTMVPFKKDQASDNRDFATKFFYDRLFGYMISTINRKMNVPAFNGGFIGVLDMYGFENFTLNSFEQLCINYANEKMQQYFFNFIFKLEQEEYKKEEVPWKDVNGKDNQSTLDLIENGIINQLDEECKLPKGSDAGFLQKLNESLKTKTEFIAPKISNGTFGVKHFAGDVMYTAAGFLEKNRDASLDDFTDILGGSRNSFFTKLFTRSVAADSKNSGKKQVTAGSLFKSSLASLVATLSATSPNYIRCVKSNKEKAAFGFDPAMVLEQLRCAGMLEAVKIRKAGYSIRLPFDFFAKRFRFLAPNVGKGEPKDVAASIIKATGVDSPLCFIGKTKIFLQQTALDVMVAKLNDSKSHDAITIQKLWRAKYARKRFLQQKNAAIVIQKYVRRYQAQNKYEKMRTSAIKIQAAVRGWFARDYVRTLRAEQRAANAAFVPGGDLASKSRAQSKAQVARVSSRPVSTIGSAGSGLAKPMNNNPLKSMMSVAGSALSDDADHYHRYLEIARNPMLPYSDDINTFSRAPLDMPLTALYAYDVEEISNIAVECFNLILSVMDSFDKEPGEIAFSQRKLLEIGIFIPELRDEIFVQICKQVTRGNAEEPRWNEMELNGWHLMCLAASSFPTSKVFRRAFTHFVNERKFAVVDDETKELLYRLISFAGNAAKKAAIGGPRFHPPSQEEVDAIREGKGLQHQFFTLDGKSETIEVMPYTTAADIINELAMRVGLENTNGWCLFETTDDPPRNFAVRGSEYIADIIGWRSMDQDPADAEKSAAAEPKVALRGKKGRKTKEAAKEAAQAQAPEKMEIKNSGKPDTAKLVLKCRLFRNMQHTMFDPIEASLLYVQAVEDFRAGNIVMTEDMAVSLAAMQLRADYRESEALQKLSQNLESIVPPTLLTEKSKADVIKTVAAAYNDMGVVDAENAKMRFLDTVKQCPTFGSAIYRIEFTGIWHHTNILVLSVSQVGIAFLSPSTREVLEVVTYDRIGYWEFDASKIIVHAYRVSDATGEIDLDGKEDLYPFMAEYAEELSNLMKEYCGRVGCERFMGESMIMPDSEVNMAMRNLEETRSMLLTCGLLNVPESLMEAMPSGGANKKSMFNLSARRKSSVAAAKSMMRLNPVSTDMSQSGRKTESEATQFWNKVMGEMKPPFLQSEDNSGGQLAEFSYRALSDLTSPEYGGENLDPTIIGNITRQLIAFCFDRPEFGDELLFQLTRFTWDFGEPDSVQSLAYWKIMSVAVGCLKPSNQYICDYIERHLKHRSVVSEKLPRELMRIDEANNAKYCLKLFRRSANSMPRKAQPSDQEMNAAFNSGSLSSRVYINNGQYFTVALQSCSTVRDIIDNVMESLHPKDCFGYCLYVVSASTSRALSLDEKFCDVISAWEMMDPEVLMEEQPFVMFQKRLFDREFPEDLTDLEEVQLVTQYFTEIQASKFPLTDDDIVTIVAAKGFIEFGRSVDPASIPFLPFLEETIPLHLRLSPEQLLAKMIPEYRRLASLNQSGYRILLNHLRTWEYFGSGVFVISQNFTNDIPSSCWLWVNIDGVHFAAKNAKKSALTILHKDMMSLLSMNMSMSSLKIRSTDSKKAKPFMSSSGAEIVSLVNDYRKVNGMETLLTSQASTGVSFQKDAHVQVFSGDAAPNGVRRKSFFQ